MALASYRFLQPLTAADGSSGGERPASDGGGTADTAAAAAAGSAEAAEAVEASGAAEGKADMDSLWADCSEGGGGGGGSGSGSGGAGGGGGAGSKAQWKEVLFGAPAGNDALGLVCVGNIVVNTPDEGTQAARAGVCVGWRIVQIDGPQDGKTKAPARCPARAAVATASSIVLRSGWVGRAADAWLSRDAIALVATHVAACVAA